MYFKFNPSQSIHVPAPFSRVMTPYMTSDTASGPIDFSIHHTVLHPGAEVDEHAHESSTEVMFCVSGKGKCSLCGVEYDFVPDSMVAAMPGEKHWIKNDGNEDLVMLCIFDPPTSAAALKKRSEDAYQKYLEENGGK